ncbi:hypothetical protein ABZ816_23770 [Actinosynnema sp. NPDC047251]|uniref:AAA+ ATPase domain-containing protein n=1 Tax=Saccharothrix espanaensis (strain ATCC 51144 / DSM 44229 / JCM 9112 / NBRC 15066 / NRRL 15764) TaxID=1179773 RepID=K0K6H6_SACES|nr:hypothetical protein [Saccharothrix espanaensis]CCH32509.1 hypothetical protein BN6_52450 [Saccharothrix espanaensis DSM 44229]
MSEVTSSPAQHADRLAADLKTEAELFLAEFTPPLDVVIERAARSLLVVGEPGAGKTALARAYEDEVLRRREPGGPVAVGFDLATWRAGTSLRAWLVDRLWRDGPVDREAAAAVVDAGLVHPVLDGVDELAPGLRVSLLDGVAALPFPVLLTSRPIPPDERFPVLELTPPAPDAGLLRWASVAEAVREDPSGPVAAALADPVNRFLFERAHLGGTSDPSALVDREVFPDADSIGRHLLEDSDPVVRRDLHRLAALFRHSGDDGVAWWRLGDRVPRRLVQALVLVVAAGLGFRVEDGVATWLRQTPGLPSGSSWVLSGCIALMAGMVLMRASRPRPPRAVDMALLGSRLTGLAVIGVFLAAAGALVGPDQVWAGWAKWAGVGLVWLWAWAVTAEADESLMDAPDEVLERDTVVTALWALLWMLGLTVVLEAETMDEPLATFLMMAGVLLAASGSASFRYLVAWLPWDNRHVHEAVSTLARTPGLVRHEGGVYHPRTEAIRRALADKRFEQPGPHTDDSPALRVVELSTGLAEEACRRVDVRGLVDASTYRGFVDRIAEDVRAGTGVILASTSTARSRYVQAKDEYARVLLPLPLHQAVVLDMVVWIAAPVGWLAAIGMSTLGLFQGFGLAVLPGAGVVLGVAAVGLMVLLTQVVRGAVRAVALLTLAGVFGGAFTWLVTEIVGEPLELPREGVATALTLGVALAVLHRVTRTFRERTTGLSSDDPKRWPPDVVARARAARLAAVNAHREWIEALVERGVRPLVGLRLAAVAKRSYAVELPEGDVRRLGQVTDATQFVATGTSRHLADLMKAMSGGSIGISGPRGVGKSTVLAMFGKFGAEGGPNALRILEPAPTNYAPREFLVHLYRALCEEVLRGAGPPPPVRSRNWPWLLVSFAGALVALGAWQVERVADAAAWVPANWRALVIGAGAVVALVPIAVLRSRSVRSGRSEDELAREARRRLDGLQYLETTTLTRTITAKPPAVAEFGGSHARARAGQVKTFPELVGEFRDFLTRLARQPGASIVVCVDELDKIGSTEEAERFLNDIKAVFGVENCFFLVTVSDDALASYSRRSSTVRTAFDSAFDVVVGVRRFAVEDTRRLLVRRVARLPEPFVWLCHVLSGGLPRDLNRVVRELYVHYASTGRRDLAGLTRALVRSDLETVVDGLSSRLADRFDGFAVRLRRHLVEARRLDMTTTALRNYRALETPEGTADELLMVYEQLRAYLVYAATVLHVFCDRIDKVVAVLEDTEATEVESLALARAQLAGDPVSAVAYVEDWKRFELRAVARANGLRPAGPPVAGNVAGRPG